MSISVSYRQFLSTYVEEDFPGHLFERICDSVCRGDELLEKACDLHPATELSGSFILDLLSTALERIANALNSA